jgi:hypothetical protein
MMELSIAELEDIDSTLELHYKYHVDSIAEEDSSDGFVTTQFTKSQLSELVKNEYGLFIAKQDGIVVAYAMAASWGYWAAWPMFSHMIKGLSSLSYAGHVLSVENSYQYGPICIDKTMRGRGLLQALFEFSGKEMAKNYPVLITFINKNNPRSFEAHARKLGLDVIHEFEYNNNQYYELAYEVSKLADKKYVPKWRWS